MAIEQVLGTLDHLVREVPATARDASDGFGETLERLIESTEAANKDANVAVLDMVTGKGDVHDAMLAMQRADLTLQLTVQVRNKLVQAYQEIMRTPV